MKILSYQVVRVFLVSFVLVSASFQLSNGVAHAKIHSPVDIQPFDEQSAKTISKGLKNISNLQDRMLKDLENAKEAHIRYLANPTPQLKAEFNEKYAQGLNTQAKCVKGMKEAFVEVAPELRKYASHLRKRIKRMQERAGYNKSPDMAGPYRERLKDIEAILSKTDELDKLLEIRLQTVADNAVGFVQRRIFEETMGGAGISSGKIFNELGRAFEVLNEFDVLTIEVLSSEYTMFNEEDFNNGWERIENANDGY